MEGCRHDTPSPDMLRSHEAAAALLARSEKVTADAVRRELGGGSMRDILPLLRTWRSQKAATPAELPAVPARVAEAAQRFTAELWAAAQTQSMEVVNSERAACAARCGEAEAERDEALTALGRAEEDADALRAELRAVRDQLAQAQKAEAVSAAEAKNSLAQLAQARVELEAARAAAAHTAAGAARR